MLLGLHCVRMENDWRRRLLNVWLFCVAACICVFLVACKDSESAKNEDVARFIRSAESYQNQGQFRAAILEAKNAMLKDPLNPNGYATLAKIYNQIGAYNATQKTLEPIHQKMPSLSLALADAYIASKKFRSALNILEGYAPASAEEKVRQQTLIARASIYLGDGDLFAKTISLLKSENPNGNDVELLEIESLFALGKNEEASEKISHIRVAGDADIKTLIALGNFSLYQNHLPEAENFFSKALGLLPKTDILTVEKVSVLKQLTETLIRQGRSSEAYRYQKLLAEANPDSQAEQERFNDAMELFKQGKFADAEKILKDIRARFPQDQNTAMLLGMAHYQQGEDKSANELFDQYIDPETATPSVIQAAALAKFRTNKIDDALALLKKGAEGQPDNPTILATYGVALLDKDPTSAEAEKMLEKSLALNPSQQRLRLVLAKRYFALKNVTQGLGQLQKAYAEQPLDFLIQQTYLKALVANGKNDLVKSEIAEFKKRNPNNPRGIFLEGWYKFLIKDYAGAQSAFEAAVAIQGNTEKNLAYAGLAEVYTIQNQPLLAIKNWQSLIELDPSQLPAYGDWLRLVLQHNRLDEAAVFLSRIEKQSEKWQSSVAFAQLLVAQKNYPEAIKHIEMALTRSDKLEEVKKIAADFYFRYAEALLRDKNMAEGKINLLKALNFEPENLIFVKAVIELEVSQKNTAEAQKILDQFVVSDNVAAERGYLQAIIRLAENNNSEAIRLLKDSWSIRPMDATAEAIYGFYERNNMQAAGFLFVDDWAVKLPKNPRPMLIKAIDLQQKNNIDAAIDLYEKVIGMMPNSLVALNNLAWIYNDRKNPKALELARKAYELDATNLSVVDTYGWILVENNRVEEGYALLQKAAELDPTNKEIRKHLQDAKARLKK